MRWPCFNRFDVRGIVAHTYAAPGPYLVKVTITAPNGSSLEIQSTAVVKPGVLTLTSMDRTFHLPENNQFLGSIGTFTSSDLMLTASDFHADVDLTDAKD